jgi:hypothetical protein
VRASGIGGELRQGYAVAGRIGAWRLTLDNAEVIGSEEVLVRGDINLDPFHSKREPLDLVLRLGDRTWTWHDARVERGQHVLIRVTGRPE